MSVRAVLEFSVVLTSFRNIDMQHQGAYAIKISLKTTESGVRKPAFPFVLSVCQTRKRRNPLHCIQSPRIDDNSAAVVSKVFIIRYVDEVVNVLDFATFRASVDARNVELESVSVEVQLLYADVQTSEPEEIIRKALEGVELTPVAKVNVEIGKLTYCQKKLLPIIFEGSAYSKAILLFHSTLVDYSYQLLEEESSRSDRGREDLTQSLAGFLFKDRDGREADYVSCASADSVYKSFISKLSRSYKSLRKLYKLYQGQRHPADWRAAAMAYTPPPLSLPGSPIQLPYASGKTSLLSSITSSIDQNPELSSSDSASMSDIAEEAPQLLSNFSTRVASHDPVQLALTLTLELNVVAGQVYQLWSKTMDLIKTSPRLVEDVLTLDLDRERFDLLSRLVLTTERQVNTFTGSSPLRDIAEIERKATSMRQSFRQFAEGNVVAQTELTSIDMPAVICEDLSIRTNLVHGMTPLPYISVSSDESVSLSSDSDDYASVPIISRKHVIVLVHGYHGTPYDMLVVKRYLGLYCPHLAVLVSSSNEGQTDGDIMQMGHRLSEEIRTFIQSLGTVGCLKISFLGHSLGGLIVRAAVPLLPEYIYAMHTYVSLCTPHLGYLDAAASLVSTGLWLIQTWRRAACLDQLMGKDSGDPKSGCLYLLAKNHSLGKFKNLLLVASHQDQYVPYESARIEFSSHSVTDQKRTSHISAMVESLLCGLKTNNLHRLDVVMPSVGQMLDNWIGRAAHVQMLESTTALAAILSKYKGMFSYTAAKHKYE